MLLLFLQNGVLSNILFSTFCLCKIHSMRLQLLDDDTESRLLRSAQYVGQSEKLKLKYSLALKKLKSEEVDTIEEGFISNLISASMTVTYNHQQPQLQPLIACLSHLCWLLECVWLLIGFVGNW